MYIHNINPVLLDLGFAQVRWYGVFYAMFLIIGYFALPYVAKKRKVNLTTEEVQMHLLGVFIAGIIGARIAYFIANEPASLFSLEFFKIWNGGLASYGGIFAAVLFTFCYAKYKKVTPYRLMDATVVVGAILPIFIRAGNFVNAEIPGKLSNLQWAVKFPAYEGFRHPVVIYALLVNIVVLAILWKMKEKPYKNGIIFWSFIGIYAFQRFFIDFFREYTYYIANLSLAQWISIPVVIVSGYFIYKIQNKNLFSILRSKRSRTAQPVRRGGIAPSGDAGPARPTAGVSKMLNKYSKADKNETKHKRNTKKEKE